MDCLRGIRATQEEIQFILKSVKKKQKTLKSTRLYFDKASKYIYMYVLLLHIYYIKSLPTCHFLYCLFHSAHISPGSLL